MLNIVWKNIDGHHDSDLGTSVAEVPGGYLVREVVCGQGRVTFSVAICFVPDPKVYGTRSDAV